MNPSETDIALITTGSEILAGEILDLNSQWISQQLHEKGFRVRLQLSCNDQLKDLKVAFETGAKLAKTVIVTGGLGPTSDDITRDAIAEFIESPLVYSEDAWEKLKRITGRKENEISETNKRQCFFPKDAEVFVNENGTADAFAVFGETNFIALPGPPFENQPLLENQVVPTLFERTSVQASTRLKWTLLGIPESNLAEIVENALQHTGVEIAYRASFPYIYLKFDCPTERYAALQSVFVDLKKQIEDYVLSTDRSFDPLEKLCASMKEFSEVQVIDLLTSGYFGERLCQNKTLQNKEIESLSVLTQIESESTDYEFVKNAYGELSETGLLILIAPSSEEHEWHCLCKFGDKTFDQRISIPERYVRRSKERVKKFVTEKTILFLIDTLDR